MIDLDDVAALRAADPSDMLGAIAALPAHCRDAYAAARETSRLPELDGVNSVVFCGMGGSAVAGDVLRSAFRDRLVLPVEVNRSPILPAYAGPHTLVVVSSYSGNTSETLASFREAVARGCRIVAVTGGGELGAECGERGLATVPVPAGFQPRAALGHLAFATLGALETAGLLPPLAADVEDVGSGLDQLVGRLGPETPTASNPAKEVATWLGERVPVVWGAEGVASVAAMRWKTQMNENGKLPAFHASMSELDHNEVVGWTEPYGQRFAVVALRHADEPEEIAARFRLSVDIARDAGALTRGIFIGPVLPLATLLEMILIGDFASCYVALRRGVDPTPVAVIDRLKAALAGR